MQSWDRMIDVQKIRKEFEIYDQNKDLVYLDSGASSLTPKRVTDVVSDYYNHNGTNVHRGVYKLSYEATERYEKSREVVANFLNAEFEEIVFTRGASDALNLVAMSYGMDNINKGDEIITSELEHHSSVLPWQMVAKRKGAKLIYLPLNQEGRITVENFKKVLSDKTKVVALTYTSNVMGYISPIKEIVKLSHEVGALVSVDAAQAVPHLKVDVKDLGCDFLSFSGHKMFGPTGVGVLYGKKKILNKMEPIQFGGDMNDNVELNEATWKDAPYKFETGTPMIAQVYGLAEAIKFIEEIGYENIQAHEEKLTRYALEQLLKIEGIKIHNKSTDTGIVTFNVDNVHPHDAASVFDKNNVCLRAGHHCAQLITRWLGELSTLRVSFYIYNDEKDVDVFIESVKESVDFFGSFF